jgi:hypothetical protein
MRIAVLIWGSLWWDRRELSINNEGWFYDGPSLPIEFARVSGGGRLTLVIKPSWDVVTTLYAISSFSTLAHAIENLRLRENTIEQNIGYYNFLTAEHRIGRSEDKMIGYLLDWKATHKIDAVIWTDLPPNFTNRTGLPFNLPNNRRYFGTLTPDELASAKEYITKAPQQIITRFRSDMQKSLI